ncbi:MAG TPA: GFA family protein [Woeseiaceae bacterium]|nr:GFA family protein [Woeseiaceae bacterium]
MAEMKGGCLCGAVRFSAANVETAFEVCHCGMCRRWAGSPLFAAAAERVTFENRDSLGVYDSSEWAARGFCSKCGSSLFYYLKPADRYVMCVGAFDDASAFHLAGEIYIDHKPPGYAFAGDLPKLTEAEVLAKFTPPEP